MIEMDLERVVRLTNLDIDLHRFKESIFIWWGWSTINPVQPYTQKMPGGIFISPWTIQKVFAVSARCQSHWTSRGPVEEHIYIYIIYIYHPSFISVTWTILKGHQWLQYLTPASRYIYVHTLHINLVKSKWWSSQMLSTSRWIVKGINLISVQFSEAMNRSITEKSAHDVNLRLRGKTRSFHQSANWKLMQMNFHELPQIILCMLFWR